MGQPVLDRAGGGVSAERAVAVDAAWRMPSRAPFALPTPAHTLFVPDYLMVPAPVADPAPIPVPAVASASSSAVAGTVRSRSATTYYEVGGRSQADLTAALRKHGPRIRGSRFFGLTEWQVSVEYRPVSGAERCGIRDLTVHVDVETRLPRWTPSARASADLHRAWEGFIAALDEHEHGHRALAAEAAEALRRRLASVRVATCDQLDPVAQQTMAAVMKTYESHNLAYDAETGHGRTQGAVWPPRP